MKAATVAAALPESGGFCAQPPIGVARETERIPCPVDTESARSGASFLCESVTVSDPAASLLVKRAVPPLRAADGMSAWPVGRAGEIVVCFIGVLLALDVASGQVPPAGPGATADHWCCVRQARTIIGIMWVTLGHLRPSAPVMLDHAGDRGAALFGLGASRSPPYQGHLGEVGSGPESAAQARRDTTARPIAARAVRPEPRAPGRGSGRSGGRTN